VLLTISACASQFLFMAITMAGVIVVARSTGSHIEAAMTRSCCAAPS
jgi:hypothetical protein